jgi:CHAD domain-containing protein
MKARRLPTALPARATPTAKPAPDFRALLHDSLHERWQSFRTELERCQKKSSEEAVHDLRVATRRLISTLDLLAIIYPEGNLRKARRRLKKQLDMFGPLRDVQVQLLSVDKMLPAFPELQRFYEHLVKRERQLVQRLGAEVNRVKTGKVKKAIDIAAKEVDGLFDTPTKPQEKLTTAIHAVDTAFNKVVERKLAVHPTDSATIHRMRVAFKKFRYLVESLAPMLNRITSKHLKAMNAFQGCMGDIQDAEVLVTNATAYARKRGLESEASLTRALEELSRRRTALIETFLASADTLFTFWKPVSVPGLP